MATISNELVAEVMRHKMECKDALQIKGSFYVGTGRTETIQSKDIPETTGFDPSENNNGVLIRDTADTNETGWRVAKITADNLKDGRVAQATNADKVLVSTDTYKPLVDALLELIYPVGSIYMTVDKDSDPAAFLGGTWERWGQGRVPVGVDENDTIFEKAENKGGEQKHQLITSEMPAHNHRGTYTKTDHYTINIPGSGDSFIEMPSGTDAVEVKYEQTQSASLVRNGSRPIGNQLDIDYTEKVTALYGVPLQGGNGAHNNLQPYITCYMWKRMA